MQELKLMKKEQKIKKYAENHDENIKNELERI